MILWEISYIWFLLCERSEKTLSDVMRRDNKGENYGQERASKKRGDMSIDILTFLEKEDLYTVGN